MRRSRPTSDAMPRPNRGLPTVPLGNPVAASRHLVRLISDAIHAAEALGLSDVVAMLEAARRAAEHAGLPDGHPSGRA